MKDSDARVSPGQAAKGPLDRRTTADLIERFDRPGPRYTSYPTAVEFHTGVDAELYGARLRAADGAVDAPLSVYVHLPFCDHRCLFCGCHVIISPDKAKAEPYLELLERELDLVCEHLPRRRLVSQLHLGGGTPTYHPPGELDRLLSSIAGRFTYVEGAELAVELDPRVTSREHVEVLGRHGFNRMSLGVQDLTVEVQQAIGRVQSREQTAAVIAAGRENGFRGINVDLIYGLPHQTVESFSETAREVVAMGADRVAAYSFAYVPWIRGHQKSIDEQTLPDVRTKIELFGAAREVLMRAGYEPIGMDHFALPDDELACARREGRLRRNFQGYAVVPSEDVIGLGISAIGDVGGLYVQNAKKLSTYREALLAGRLPVERGYDRSRDDELRRAVIHDLMCNLRVDVRGIERAWGIDFSTEFAAELERLRECEREGLVEIGADTVRATPTGELFVRNLAMCFDRYLPDGGVKRVFSRTV